ncbi:MAG: hypothetical protein WAL04_01535 [Acidimicrobiales bacterium]|jgi:hypothetical protein
MTTPTPDRFADDAGQGGAQPGESAESGRLSGCEFFGSVASELALGSLTGADRSAALAHLDGCEECSALITELSAAADALLWVAPEADPPAGFEVRWLGRIRPDSAAAAPAPSPAAAEAGGGAVIAFRRRAQAWFAAAAAAIVIAGAGIGVGVAVAPQHGTQAATGQIRLASLRSISTDDGGAPGTAVGEVAVTAGSPSWILMTFQKPGWSGQVECVVSQHGQSRKVGTFFLYDGTGTWALRLPSSGASVTSAEVRDMSGAVLATATFAN